MVQDMRRRKSAGEIFGALTVANSILKKKKRKVLKAQELLNPSEHFYVFVNGMTTSTHILLHM